MRAHAERAHVEACWERRMHGARVRVRVRVGVQIQV